MPGCCSLHDALQCQLNDESSRRYKNIAPDCWVPRHRFFLSDCVGGLTCDRGVHAKISVLASRSWVTEKFRNQTEAVGGPEEAKVQKSEGREVLDSVVACLLETASGHQPLHDSPAKSVTTRPPTPAFGRMTSAAYQETSSVALIKHFLLASMKHSASGSLRCASAAN